MADAKELEALLARAAAVLSRHVGVPPGARGLGSLGPTRIVPDVDAVFYRMGIADTSSDGKVGVASLKLEAPGATPRTFLIAVYVSNRKLVVATRWVPNEERPLIVRGELAAARWKDEALEGAVQERVVSGRSSFEDDMAKGRGFLDSSSDLLGL